MDEDRASSPDARFRPAGDAAVLVDLPDLGTVHRLAARSAELVTNAISGVEELVPGATTVLVRFRPFDVDHDTVVASIADMLDEIGDDARRGATDTTAPGKQLDIEVVYDGADLAVVARETGLSIEEVIRRHTATQQVVAFSGFAPGFAYLAGGDPSLVVPRRAKPRTRIPAGSVALAGPFSGIYPRESPGGWQLIGTTSAAVWNVDADPPARLQPGDRVRFRAVHEHAQPASGITSDDRSGGEEHTARGASRAAIRIDQPGLLTLVQDAGRAGFASMGVGRSGAADLWALHEANRLVGNRPNTAALEVLAGGLRLESIGSVVVGLAGAPAAVTITRAGGDTHRVMEQRALSLADGDVAEVAMPSDAIRTMVAVRGGLDVSPVLGSRSYDTLAKLGPPPLAAGEVIAVGTEAVGAVGDPRAWAVTVAAPEPLDIPVVMGPRDDWFTDEAITALLTSSWQVSAATDRVGVRLEGPRLERRVHDELPSEGVVAGSIQVPPDGRPIVLGADHPVTGGYPVIAVASSEGRRRLAHAAPGRKLSFSVVTTPR